jgi:molybdenum cofactor cytidylyltransferase
MEATGVAALLLADADSRWPGQPMPLLPWMNTTLLAFQVGQMALAGVHPTVVVLGHEAKRVAVPLRSTAGVILVANPSYDRGESTSIRAGLRALPSEAGSFLIASISQPRRAETMAALIAAYRRGSHLITLPSYRGRMGRPIVMSTLLAAEIALLANRGEGLEDLLRRHQPDLQVIDVDSPEVLIDINSLDDYRSALDRFKAG